MLTAPQDGGTEEVSELFCLVTDLLDPEGYPALDLACCYPERWGCETVIGHHKTDMGEGQPVLRSKDPGGAQQEMWALFAVYQALCKIIGIGVNAMGIPPAKISFPNALAAATDTVAAFPPDQPELALATFLLKILMPGTFVRDRPDRNSPRKSKKAGDFPARKPASLPSSKSPGKSSFTCYNHGRSLNARTLGTAPGGAQAPAQYGPRIAAIIVYLYIGWIIASMVRRRDWLMFSHLTPFAFPGGKSPQ